MPVTAVTSTPTVQLAFAASAGKFGFKPLANIEMLEPPELAVKLTRKTPLPQSVSVFASGAMTIPEGRLLLKFKLANPDGLLELSIVKVSRLV